MMIFLKIITKILKITTNKISLKVNLFLSKLLIKN